MAIWEIADKDGNVLLVYYDKDSGKIVETEIGGDLELPGWIRSKQALDLT